MGSQTFTYNIKALFDASDVKAKVGELQGTFSKLKLPDNLTADLNKSFVGVNKALDDFISKTEKGIKTKADATGITKSFDVVTKELTNLDNLLLKVKSQLGDGADLSKIIKIDKDTRDELNGIEQKIKTLQSDLAKINTSKLSQLETLLSKIKSGSGAHKQGQAALELFKQGDVEGAITSLNKIIKKLEDYKKAHTDANGKTDRDLTNVTNSLTQLTEMRKEMVGAQTDSAKKITEINNESARAAQVLANAQSQVTNEFKNTSTAVSDYQKKAVSVRGDVEALTSSQAQFVKEVDQVKSRIQYFFGLANGINLVKRAIRSAVETVKDLDAAMTETAVVTKNTVSDMWAKLPEYTKRANELGVSTLDAYKSATLYYQQGLNDEQAGALSVETLKMARIAGLDAAEATDRMTNALRGFNMELNEASAQKVDDVYSQLAAMSASNVDEISTAMTKVASLAHNANMEFETTAAFLAQIIETTRESAETAGTALKTVVARFSEVKKLVDTEQLKGTDEEGQLIDVNKVSAALRTAGIDLNKYFLGEVGLDDIFMELASKWDSLTNIQQRYIATQAAGSRQQSRFIALMQDYARTQELVGAAYNANGASARQFEKTQESLQSKLARLKNAWNEFLMGLANNAVIKTVVDVLTTLLNVVNNLTSAFGNGVGAVLKWIAAFGAYASLRKAFSGTGIATKAIGGLVGNTPIGKAIKVALGAGTIDEKTKEFVPTEKAPRTKIFGTGGWFSNLGQRITDFKVKHAYSPGTSADIYKEQLELWNEQLEAAGQLPSYDLEKDIPLARPKKAKTLFGAAGNAFTETKLGGAIQSKLGAIPKIGSVFTGAAGGAATLAASLGAVAVAAGLVYAAWRASPQGQLKHAQNQAKKAQKEAEETEKQLKSLTSLQETYKEKTEEVDKATNIRDRNAAIKERNQAILDAIKEDGTLAQYVITEQVDNEIILKVDEAGLAEAAKTATEIAEKAAINAYFKEGNVDVKEANVARTKLENIASSTGVYDTLQLSNMSVDDLYKYILDNSSQIGDKQLSKAAELYNSYINSMGSAEQQVRLGYGKALASAGATDELTNTLLPILSKLWVDTGKQLSDTKITELAGRNDLLPILKAYSGDMNTKEVSLVNTNIDNEDLIKQIFGLDEIQDLNQAYSDLETTLGLQEGSVEKIIKANTKLQKQAQESVTKNATLQMIQAGKGQYNVDAMAKYLSLDSFDNQQYIANLLESIGTSDFGSLLINPIIDAMKAGNWEDSELQQWVDSIDFSNPIQAFNALNSAANGTNQQIKSIANEILETSDAQTQFSTSARLSYLLTSESYDTLSESLGKFIEENGKITSGNIKELAESNKDLNALLEDNKFSASGLAEILTHIEDGTLSVLDLNDALIAAASAMDDLDGIAQDTINDLNSFDPGFDENDITGFIQKAYKTISENLEVGAVGNNQNRAYLEKIFGSGIFDFGDIPVEQYSEKYEQTLNYYTGILEANQENMFSAWQGVAKTFKSGAGEYNGLVEQVGDEIFIHAEEFGLNTEQLINVLAKYTGESDTWLRMMVTDFKNNSADFKYEMGKQDLPNALQAWYDALPQINGQKIYEEADFQKLGTLLGVGATAVKDAVKDIDQSAGILTEIDWTAGTGEKSAKNYIDVIQSLGKQIRGGEDWTGLINFEALAEGVKDVGLEAQFNSIFNEIVAEEGEFTADFGRGLETITLQAGETASDAVSRVKKEIADEKLAGDIGQSIVSALSEMGETDININFLPDSKAVDDYIDEKHDAEGTVIYGVDSSGPDAYESELHIAQGETRYKAVEIPEKEAATGGIVQSYAKGSSSINLKPGISLTGEEGPEIIWNKEKGYAYITGENHPEFQNLQPGDRVFNTQETKKILGGAATGSIVPSFARGYGGATSSKKNSGGGGGGGSGSGDKDKTSEEWKNELDWLYNLMEDIVELERDQKALEEDYEDALKDQTKTGRDLYNLLIKQLGNLYTQLDHQTFALQKREQEMREFMDTTNDQDKYLWYNWQDRTLEIDWDAIDQIKDEELYKHVKDLIDEAEEIQDKMDDAEDAIIDINNQIQELENIWRDTFTDFEKRVYDAIVKQYQTVIDNYSELNDTLNNSNSQILDSLQKQISLERQIRDNTKTEEEITDDEARLAYLRRDTSGGNDLAALQLEKELSEQRQNYEDTLVDQAISRLQEDNDAAAQQRQQQIDIMQAQLDYQSQNGEFNAAVRELLETAISDDGHLATDSDLYKLLAEQENIDAMSDVQREVWDEELNGTFKEVAAFLLKQNAEENGTFYTALTAAVKTVSTAIGSYSQAMTKMGSEVAKAASGGGGSGGSSSGGGYTGGYTPSRNPSSTTSQTASLYGVNNASAAYKSTSPIKSLGTAAARAEQILLKKSGRAGGGLVSQTGIAMLHGTVDEPEYVLNARQTDAFLKLADVLPSMMGSSTNTQNNTFGSTYVNLSVNLDSVNPDYDVDRMVDLLKDKLYDAGSYRNVNSLSFIR